MRKTKAMFVVALAASLAAMSSCSNFFGSSSGKGDDNTSTATATLADYKITMVAARSASDPQPYGTKIAAVMKRKQIYFDGMTYNSTIAPRLIGYEGGTTTVKYTGGNFGWSANPHVSIPARLGSDGVESIVSVVFVPASTSYIVGENQGTVSLEIWDGKTLTLKTPFKGTVNETFSLYLCKFGENLYPELNSGISAAAGDMNGDGLDEIGFCVGNRFVILDGNLSTVLYDDWAMGSGAVDSDYSTFHPSRVVAGDIKGDGTVNFITTYGSAEANAVASYKIYEGATPTVIASGSLGGGSCPLTLMYANVTLGDLDGDGLKELIFAGPQDTAGLLCNVVAANWVATSSNLEFEPKSYAITTGNIWGSYPIPALVAFNPAPKTESTTKYPEVLLACNTILRYDSSTSDFVAGYKGLTTITQPVYANVCVGDVDYDNQDDLISLSSYGGVGFEVYSLGSGNSFTQTSIPATVGYGSGYYYMSLCAADLEGQSIVLEYLGTSVKYTNPQLVAVLASPPYYADAASNTAFGNCGTSYGTSSSTSTSDTHTMTFSASLTIGGHDDCPLWSSAGSTDVKYTLGIAFTYGFSKEKTTEYSHVYSTIAGSDAVLYSCVPYDVYSYRVLSSPDGKSEGETITVNFPREPQLILMDRETFNALPENPLSVGSSILCHTLGVPGSYKNRATLKALCSADGGLIDNKGMPSPIGDSVSVTSTVSISNTETTKLGGGVSYTASVEAVVLGLLFGTEAGFNYDYEYSVTTGESAEISGSVPGINSSDSIFQFGIAGYKVTDTTLQTAPFLVVSYWVE